MKTKPEVYADLLQYALESYHELKERLEPDAPNKPMELWNEVIDEISIKLDELAKKWKVTL